MLPNYIEIYNRKGAKSKEAFRFHLNVNIEITEREILLVL